MRSQKTEKHTSDALALVEEMTGKSKEMADLVEQEQANLDVAREIYALRIKAKLSQAELARKVGTTQSVISRLEDADYDGHSLAMLRRIASALEKRVPHHCQAVERAGRAHQAPRRVHEPPQRRHYHRNSPGMVFCSQDLRHRHLPLDGFPEALGKGHDAAFVAFGLIYVEAVFS